jgi:hypothetical protein
MNVRYALAAARSQPPAGWRHLGSFPGFELLENERVLPRAFVPRVVHAAKLETVIDAMKHCTDFGQEAWIESASEQSSDGSVTGIRQHGSHLRLAVSMQGDGWVVVSEPAWRGWRVYDRDRALPVAYADAAFIAFPLGKGDHDIRMFYRPRSFEIGCAISLVTLLMLVVYGILRRRAS